MSISSSHRHSEPERLACDAQAGSSVSFEKLVRRFEGPLHNFLSMMVRDETEAEDLTQEAFLRAWQKLERYDSSHNFSTWLFAIARRCALSHSRRKKPTPVANESLGTVRAQGDGIEELESRDERENIWRLAREALTPEQCGALWLHYADGVSYAEIASILGRRETATRVFLLRARRSLANFIEKRTRTVRAASAGSGLSAHCARGDRS